MSYLAINNAGEDENSDDEGSATTAAELEGFLHELVQREDVPQDLRQRAQVLAAR
ncbi:hypothetical protein ACFC58_31745 [Kitasatospora purpeofusca]|uniref:hypothetical protein n=1 Tax=Kitasatospora purpeofusca TaxID=67352 RepID=UPI0035D973CB